MGADASVKLWPLADWLPADAVQPPASGSQQEQRQHTSGDGSGANAAGSSGGGGKNSHLPVPTSSNGGNGGNDGDAGAALAARQQALKLQDGAARGLVVSDLPVTPTTPAGTGGASMSTSDLDCTCGSHMVLLALRCCNAAAAVDWQTPKMHTMPADIGSEAMTVRRLRGTVLVRDWDCAAAALPQPRRHRR